MKTNGNVSHETYLAACQSYAEGDIDLDDLTAIAVAYRHDNPPDVSHETYDIPARVKVYLKITAGRDQLVKDMLTAGWTKKGVAKALGMGRPTINRILGANYAYDHGVERYTDPKPKTSADTGLPQ